MRLNFFEVLMICIGSIVGTGVFLIPGIVAGFLGPGSFFLWLIIGLLTIPIGFTFAELASISKKSGGPLIFVKTALGDFFGFIAGWSSWLISCITISSIALAIPFFISFFFPLEYPEYVLISLGFIGFFTVVNYFGIKFGAKAQILLTASTILLLIFFIFISFPHVDLNNFSVLFPLGVGGFGIGLLLVFEAFMGWEAVTIISEEIKSARRFLPKAIILTTLIIALLYITIAFVALGVLSWDKLAEAKAPLAEVVKSFSLSIATIIIFAGILVHIACLNSWILTTSRLPYALAKEKMFLNLFKHKNKYNTPHKSLALQSLFSSIIILTGSYIASLFILLSVALILYMLCFISAIRIKKTTPSKIKFKVPNIFPVVSFLGVFLLFLQLSPWNMLSGIMLIFLGVPAYVLIKLSSDRRFIEKFYDSISLIFDKLFPIWYTKPIRQRVVRNADLKRDHIVLDYGCGTGITTLEVAKRVKKVVAADIAKKPMERALRKAEEMKANIIFVKLSKAAPFGEVFDRIVCVGALEHFVEPSAELKKLYSTLKKGGVISFMSFGKSFGINPPEFLRDNKHLRELFEGAGFKDVKIKRIKKFLVEYIFIKGKK